jgi:hypothetical protein
MNVLRENGIARTVAAIAPNKQAYYSQFPHTDNLGAMINSNRFAVTAYDLTGE